MKIKEQTRKLAAGCSKQCFEVVDRTDEVSIHTYGKATLTWFEEIFEEYEVHFYIRHNYSNQERIQTNTFNAIIKQQSKNSRLEPSQWFIDWSFFHICSLNVYNYIIKIIFLNRYVIIYIFVLITD